jgi:hypothetical protein
MKVRPLSLIMVACILPFGCDGGAGPSVQTAPPAKSAADAGGAGQTPPKAVSPDLQKKRDKMGVRPTGPA